MAGEAPMTCLCPANLGYAGDVCLVLDNRQTPGSRAEEAPPQLQLYIMLIIGAQGSRRERGGLAVFVPSHGRCRISLILSVAMSAETRST